MAQKLEGNVALVTGGAAGIGRSTAMMFAREGAKVVVADVNREGGEETVQLIAEAEGEAIFVKADVTQSVEVQAIVEQCVQTYGRLDYAFNNAGVAPAELKPIADYPEDDWDRVININLKSVFLCLKYELQQMRQQNSGAIVNVASIFGQVSIGAGSASYTASKHGVVGLTKAAALENATNGIRVNAVCPGVIETNLGVGRLQDPEWRVALQNRHPMGRFGTPDEVAEAVIWLCSDAASFVTGQTLTMDGGYVAQ